MSASNLIGTLIAIAIPALAIYLISALDLFGTGKGSTILICAAWGAIAAFGLALQINNVIERFLGYELVVAISGPLTEELLKAAILIYLVRQPRFIYFVDGAIYGFAVGIAFSISENVIVYLPAHPDASIVLAISRVLSASLMHATTSAIVGISLGRQRRSQSRFALLLAFAGLLVAFGIHAIFNSLAETLVGIPLLLVAIGIGLGGSVFIGFQIIQGLNEEKRRFQATLGISVGVTSNERKAIQQTGDPGFEKVLLELEGYFGKERTELIRRLLVIQANIGILRNNLSNPVSERLRKAWEAEIAKLRAETDQIRNDLGVYVMSFLRGVFPDDDVTINAFGTKIAESDPTQVHSFDIFVNMSAKANTFSADQLAHMADVLHSVEVLQQVELADLENLSRSVAQRTFSDGEVLFEAGDTGDAMYIIEDGSINVLSKDRQHHEILLRTSLAGEVIGDLALLDGHARSAKAVAVGTCKTLVLRRDNFMMFLKSRPTVIIAVLQFLSGRVRESTEIIETSATWASNMALGNYEKAQAVGKPSPTGQSRSNISISNQTISRVMRPLAADAVEGLNSETPEVLRGIFSKVSNVLEEREDQIRRKALEDDTLPDISGLPEHQRRVMALLMRDPLFDGLTFEAIQDKLAGLPDLNEVLNDLDRDNWLAFSGEAPHIRYKLNPKRRRAKTSFDSLRSKISLNNLRMDSKKSASPNLFSKALENADAAKSDKRSSQTGIPAKPSVDNSDAAAKPKPDTAPDPSNSSNNGVKPE